jgi:membrane protein implicated in regulation of membrane protease activity
MMDWWRGLDQLNQTLYIGAAYFSLLFLWQFISALLGLAGEGADVEMDIDADLDIDGMDLDDLEAASVEEAAESIASFKILSIRAILAFCTLFCWAGAMYLDADMTTSRALIYAALWGLVAWIVVAVLVYLIRKLAETGTPRLATCVGHRGTVYLNIPDAGFGEVRVIVSGAVTRVKARGRNGQAFDTGTPVKVVRTLDANTIEVENLDTPSGDKGASA